MMRKDRQPAGMNSEAARDIDRRDGRSNPSAIALARREVRCAACGYGAMLGRAMSCPMCGGEVWDFVDWRPFHIAHVLLDREQVVVGEEKQTTDRTERDPYARYRTRKSVP